MMSKSKSLYYLAYQDFPAGTANSQQTVATCKYFARNHYNVHLFFPLRSRNSSDNFTDISNFYEIEKTVFDITGIKFKYKFENKKIFKKINFVLIHILWSYYCVNQVINNFETPSQFMTRSEWVFFFLSRKKFNVVYECHKITKLRKFVIRKSLRYESSKIIFINNQLFKSSGLKNMERVLIQSNGYDEDFFYNNQTGKSKKIVFAGNLFRFGKIRNFDFILKAFENSKLNHFELIIVGGSPEESKRLEYKFKEIKNIKFISYKPKKYLAAIFNESEIGLLINEDNQHSQLYTDPLKFYEYLASGLKVVAPDFISHKEIDKFKNVFFFSHNNYESFINSIQEASEHEFVSQEINNLPTIDKRVKNIINFISK